ncbi:MAG: GTP-binding protein [Eubacteriales bacterium]
MFRRNKGKKTYLVNGFLESGKTEFIKYTVEQPYFKSKGTTLLILCEEGENTYERSFLRRNKIVLEFIEKEEDFNLEKLTELEKTHNPQRVLIEYNGMWSNKGIELPTQWILEQQITTIDTTSFGMYYMNMKSMIGEMVKNSELVLFNRADGIKDLTTYKRNIKMVNQAAEIVFEGTDAEIPAVLEEELPYDIHVDVLPITEETYGIWFLDTLENTERYEGKKVEFIGQVMKKDSFPSDYFVPIRAMMTCCEDDVAMLGFVCQYEKISSFANESWVKVEAVIKKEYWADYGDEGPVLYATSVIEAIPPKNKVIDFR